MSFLKSRIIAVTAITIMGLSACSFDSPSKITSNKIQLLETSDYDTYATSNVSAFLLANIAERQKNDGNGPMDITVTYDPTSSVNTKIKAQREAKRMKNVLQSQGVRDVRVTNIPVNAPPNYSVTTMRYTRLSATGPKDCGLMPGYMDRNDAGNTDLHKNYDYGCTIETTFAKQIARPSDLLGQDDFETRGSGRYAENAISGSSYYGGAPAPALEGESSSDN